MLIIAIPKSGSSSLISTLCRAHGLPNATSAIRGRLFAHLPRATDYRQMANFHSELVEIDAAVVQGVAAADLFTKHHIPPTPVNQSRLAGIRKVVLLRDAEDIVRAYKRGDESGAFKLQSHEFCFCFSEQSWLAQARTIGLLDELRAFAAGWRAHEGDMLLLSYDDLLVDPGGALARVEDYFGLPRSGAVTLVRERYSRERPGPEATNPIALLLSRRRLLLRRLLSGTSKLLLGNTSAYDKVRDIRRRRVLARENKANRLGQ